MKNSFFLLFFIGIYTYSTAQDNEDRYDNYYIEVGGSGLYYSINFERSIPSTSKKGYTYSIGCSPFYALSGSAKRYYDFNKSHQVNYGIGLTCQLGSFDAGMFLFMPIGYKYTFPNNRVYLGMTLYGLIGFNEMNGITPWAGLRVGYNYNMKCKYCQSK